MPALSIIRQAASLPAASAPEVLALRRHEGRSSSRPTPPVHARRLCARHAAQALLLGWAKSSTWPPRLGDDTPTTEHQGGRRPYHSLSTKPPTSCSATFNRVRTGAHVHVRPGRQALSAISQSAGRRLT